MARWDDRTYAQWHTGYGIAEGVLTKWWNPIALSMGFLPADEMSARPMTTVFHHFSRNAEASRVGFLDGPPAERLHSSSRTTSPRVAAKSAPAVRAEMLDLSVDGPSLSSPACVSNRARSRGRRLRAGRAPAQRPPDAARRAAPNTYFDNLWRLKSVPVMNVQVWFDRYVSTTDNLFFTADAPFSVFADLAVTSPLYDRTGGSVVSMAVAPPRPLWHLTDDEIAQQCLDALYDLWPSTRGAGIMHKTARQDTQLNLP